MSDWLPPPKDRYERYPWEADVAVAVEEDGGDGIVDGWGLGVAGLVVAVCGVVLVVGLGVLVVVFFPE